MLASGGVGFSGSQVGDFSFNLLQEKKRVEVEARLSVPIWFVGSQICYLRLSEEWSW